MDNENERELSDNPLDWLEDMCGQTGWSFERLGDTDITISVTEPTTHTLFVADVRYDQRQDSLQLTFEVTQIPDAFLEDDRRQTISALLDAVNRDVESGCFRALKNGLMISFISVIPKSECAIHAERHTLPELFANYAHLCSGYQLVFGLLAQRPDDTPTAAAHILHLLKPMGTA
ncbi:MAG: hypothetical protein ACK5XX_01845 [Holosporales bacterium]|jgi:hypothetical protein